MPKSKLKKKKSEDIKEKIKAPPKSSIQTKNEKLKQKTSVSTKNDISAAIAEDNASLSSNNQNPASETGNSNGDSLPSMTTPNGITAKHGAGDTTSVSKPRSTKNVRNNDPKKVSKKEFIDNNAKKSAVIKKEVIKKEEASVPVKKEDPDEKKERLSWERTKRRANQKRKAAAGNLLKRPLPYNTSVENQVAALKFKIFAGETRLIKEQLRSQTNRGRFAIPKKVIGDLIKEVLQTNTLFTDEKFKLKKAAVEALHEACESELNTMMHIAERMTMACATTEPILLNSEGKPVKNEDGTIRRVQKYPAPGSTITVKLAAFETANAILKGELGGWGTRSYRSAHNFVDPVFDEDENIESDKDYDGKDDEEDMDVDDESDEEEEKSMPAKKIKKQHSKRKKLSKSSPVKSDPIKVEDNEIDANDKGIGGEDEINLIEQEYQLMESDV